MRGVYGYGGRLKSTEKKQATVARDLEDETEK